MYPSFKAGELKHKVDSAFPKMQEDVWYRAESSNLVSRVPGWKAAPKFIWDCSRTCLVGFKQIVWDTESNFYGRMNISAVQTALPLISVG